MSSKLEMIENPQPNHDNLPWCAIRLFSLRWKAVNEYLRENGMETFVPMTYVDYEDENGHVKRKLKPVVSNLVFVRKTVESTLLSDLVYRSPYKMSLIKRNKKDTRIAEIPAGQMEEFKLMCNPEVEMRKFISEEEAKLKAGDPVEVIFGPFKSLSGRLVRQNHKYYLLKEVPGMAVMLKVSRWCCKPVGKKREK
ncbi:MAG: UpxY family transcription antiterminator [Prevotellaceae bacterium]|nr:UpxY family transcription antiterminator [Prevotellaceae bacterium]MDY2633183.1 UpxY family transcription antiterminator [Prevotella sp.]